MHKTKQETKQNNSRAVMDEVSRKQGSIEPALQFEDNRPQSYAQRTLQATANNSHLVKQLKTIREMSNGLPARSGPENSTQAVQRYDKKNFNRISNIVDAYSAIPGLIANVDNSAVFNEKISALKAYIGLNEEEQNMVKSQVKMKIRHSTMQTIAPEDNDDIKKNFNSLKSCVITALLYAEGGSVLGTSSVEGLHYILYTRFPKWRQYSDDAVLAQIYQTFGYQTADVNAQARHKLVTTQNKVRGMTASTGDVGHMVGFKKDGNSYKFRDNDHGESPMNDHDTRNDQVNKIWWK